MLIMRYISIERNYSKSKSLDIQCRTIADKKTK